MPGLGDRDGWLQQARELLTGNLITVDGHRYTAPSLDTVDFGRKDYANQFLWDSCFHAIAWRWIDPEMAQDELVSLVSHQVMDGTDAGMIHAATTGEAAQTGCGVRRIGRSQPPLIAVAIISSSSAVKIVHSGRDLSRLSAYHDWFDRRRDPNRDGLVY
jgi:hypothetical protein